MTRHSFVIHSDATPACWVVHLDVDKECTVAECEQMLYAKKLIGSLDYPVDSTANYEITPCGDCKGSNISLRLVTEGSKDLLFLECECGNKQLGRFLKLDEAVADWNNFDFRTAGPEGG